MEHVISADGTRIALHRAGAGPSVVIVNGAFSTARDAGELATALADAGFTAITYDRRARGDSDDARAARTAVDPLREVDDLAAVIAAAGGDAAVLGHSSGAVLALVAAARGIPVRRLFLSEPPFHFGVDDADPSLPERLQALVDAERTGDAVVLFQREGVGLPDAMVEQIRQSPLFDALRALAQSTVYDAALTRDVSTPTPDMLAVAAPVTILCGEQTFPMLSVAAEKLAAAMPGAELLITPESLMHRLDVATATRVVAERLGASEA
ncbi:MAG: alpha/beta fold hydrolase [Microbacterium sp.]|uniref:alpha/beta fold hydrolase n=1 Tax=Microbacterium sp. TaxID=51671 RepID=UPI001AC765DC|nr:alpha/beta fold hydrolase [Microbacterium sp.]MBN9178153.1 alpha/beta fold hydrolase [Microbacterium sp.]